MLAASAIGSIVKKGELTIIDADGRTHVFGPGGAQRVTMRLHDKRLHTALFFNAPLALGEAYMDGTITVENGRIDDLLDLLMMNLGTGTGAWPQTIARALQHMMRRIDQYNPARRAKRNVAHHYDLSGDLYALFLDGDRQYSCAYYANPDDTLEVAQEQKKRHIASKLALTKGQRILDIGSGWGGLGLYLAQIADARVTGVTLSEEQLKVATLRAAEAGFTGRVEFRLEDYRALQGTFDRIVSVGMFEHVGIQHYRAYFDKVRDLLTDDGVALLHWIGRSDGPGVTSPWIQKYIFPGGYTPALSEVLPVIERSGLYVTDLEVLRLHYAETLKAWLDRFRAHWREAAAIYDERFCRMWEFYLAGSQMGFRHQGLVVHQIQLTKQIDTLPMTRDYMFDWERAHAPQHHWPRVAADRTRTGTSLPQE